jgi:enoyl-CoA hydratase/carnithine racemase
MSEHIRFEVADGVATVAIARPAKKNALTLDMYDALVAAFERAAADDAVQVILLQGAEGVFTAGNDLMDFMQRPPAGEDSPVFRFLTALSGAEKPLVVAVDGPAVGLGTTLLLHADLVYASDRARFHMPFINLGLVPEGGSSFLLPGLAGHVKAAELLMFGDPFDAQTALRIGLVNEVLPADALLARARARAAELAKKPSQALRATKRLLKEGTRAAVQDTLRREGAVFVERLSSPEAMAAFQAFFTRK